METILNIIPDTNDYQDKLKEVNPEEIDNAGFWYLHGDLETRIGFDKAVITNCKSLGLLKVCMMADKPYQKLYLNGMVKCKVDGIEEDCTGFFWTNETQKEGYWIQRGLVVLDSDKKCYEDAKKKYEEKRAYL